MSKRNAVQKIFKNDIAELLRRGHDYSAYQRVTIFFLKRVLCFFSYSHSLVMIFVFDDRIKFGIGLNVGCRAFDGV